MAIFVPERKGHAGNQHSLSARRTDYGTYLQNHPVTPSHSRRMKPMPLHRGRTEPALPVRSGAPGEARSARGGSQPSGPWRRPGEARKRFGGKLNRRRVFDAFRGVPALPATGWPWGGPAGGDADGFAGFLTPAVFAAVDAGDGLLHLLEQLALAIARAQFQRVFFLDRGAVGRVRHERGCRWVRRFPHQPYSPLSMRAMDCCTFLSSLRSRSRVRSSSACSSSIVARSAGSGTNWVPGARWSRRRWPGCPVRVV